MSRAVIRRSCVSGVAVLSLALLAGCADSESDSGSGESGAGASAEAVAEEGSTPVLSAAELAEVALKEGDVDGHKVSEPSAGERAEQTDVEVDDEACAPLAYALAGTVIGEPAATVHRQTISQPDPGAAVDAEDVVAAMNVSTVMVGLASYEGDGAQAAMDSLGETAEGCAKGFTGTVAGAAQKVTKVAEGTAPQGADQAVAVDATVQQDGETLPVKVVVVRNGSTLAYFTAVSFTAAGAGQDFEVPAEVVDAQLAKLA
ncbi:hypothetical protein [Streptomyces sp. NPDC002845]